MSTQSKTQVNSDELKAWEELERPIRVKDILDPTREVNDQGVLETRGNKDFLQHHLNNKIHKNYIFAGPPGTGKTTSAIAYANEWLEINAPKNDWTVAEVIELNASDDRGIDVIREIGDKIKDDAYYVFILDEADSLTEDAMTALRRTMEKAKTNPNAPKLFILTCNYPSKFIEALISRCDIFYFPRIPYELAVPELVKIAKKHGVDKYAYPSWVDGKEDRKKAFNEFFEALYERYQGDMRKMISTLQNFVVGDEQDTLNLAEPPETFGADEWEMALDRVIRPMKDSDGHMIEISYDHILKTITTLIWQSQNAIWSNKKFIDVTRTWVQKFSKELDYTSTKQMGITIAKYQNRLTDRTNDRLTQLSAMVAELRLIRRMGYVKENYEDKISESSQDDLSIIEQKVDDNTEKMNLLLEHIKNLSVTNVSNIQNNNNDVVPSDVADKYMDDVIEDKFEGETVKVVNQDETETYDIYDKKILKQTFDEWIEKTDGIDLSDGFVENVYDNITYIIGEYEGTAHILDIIDYVEENAAGPATPNMIVELLADACKDGEMIMNYDEKTQEFTFSFVDNEGKDTDEDLFDMF